MFVNEGVNNKLGSSRWERIASKLLGHYDNSLLDKAVLRWMTLSVPLVILFSLVEGTTWWLISRDLLSGDGGHAWAEAAAMIIGILIMVFALLLDRSIFVQDLGSLKFVAWRRDAVSKFNGEAPTPQPDTLGEHVQVHVGKGLGSGTKSTLKKNIHRTFSYSGGYCGCCLFFCPLARVSPAGVDFFDFRTVGNWGLCYVWRATT